MNFLEMQTQAIDLLHELANHPNYSLDKLKTYLNRGNLEFVRQTKCIEDTIEITTVAQQFEYSEADAGDLQYLYLPYQIRYQESTDNVGYKLWPFKGGYVNLPRTKIYGTPEYYWIRNIAGKQRTNPEAFTGVRIGTWPIVNDSSKKIIIDAYLYPKTLTNDTDYPEYQSAWHDAIVFYAAYRMFMNFSHLRKGWHEKALELKALFDNIVFEANNVLSQQDDAPFLPIDVTEDYDALY